MQMVVVLLVFVGLWHNAKTESNKPCTTPNGETATCISLNSCSILYDAINDATKDPEIKKFLRSSLCGWESKDIPQVCCGTKATYAPIVLTESKINVKKELLPDRTICGFQQDKDKILGGEDTAPEEFPWLALLGYTDRHNRLKFGCGGALINNRYVLTAGHCVTTKNKLTTVRLGEWNLNTTRDCIGKEPYRYCLEAQDIEVESFKLHERYHFDPFRGVSYDIALVRMKTPVKFSSSIMPICLPTSDDRSEIGSTLWVAGWGATEVTTFQKSIIKQKLEVPVVDSSECETKYKTRGDISINSLQLCAGGEIGKDSCKGDSGGPLMTTLKDNELQYYVEGIVSFGISCGTELPGVYTRVSEFIGWIESNVSE